MPIRINRLSQLKPEVQQLLEEARLVSRNAYNPYSKFFVGAAVRVESGKIFRGTILENASYGLTICAEAAALAASNTENAGPVAMIAIVGGQSEEEIGPAVTPCGRCRQLLHESSHGRRRDIEVYCANLQLSEIWLTTADELLPLAFGPKSLY